MNKKNILGVLFLSIFLVMSWSIVLAQSTSPPYDPSRGSGGGEIDSRPTSIPESQSIPDAPGPLSQQDSP